MNTSGLHLVESWVAMATAVIKAKEQQKRQSYKFGSISLLSWYNSCMVLDGRRTMCLCFARQLTRPYSRRQRNRMSENRKITTHRQWTWSVCYRPVIIHLYLAPPVTPSIRPFIYSTFAASVHSSILINNSIKYSFLLFFKICDLTVWWSVFGV